ncbi:MAG: 50S ribosomal protein L18e [Candidatus Woesearchaeota archaeon]|nr:50S ribosomal protein L18e [Candidatus Woesearchaeota archaeon]
MKNTQLTQLIMELKKASIEQDVAIWKRVATDLEKPTKQRRIVNLSKIDRYCKDDETIVVPGKVLSMGDLKKKATIAAYNFSGNAMDKIKEAGGKAISIQELLKKNPKGNKVRILG